MDPENVYRLLQRQPFQPVRVHLRDGRRYDILAREFAVVGVTFVDVGAQAEGAPAGVWGPTVTIPLDKIDRVETLNGSAPTPRP